MDGGCPNLMTLGGACVHAGNICNSVHGLVRDAKSALVTSCPTCLTVPRLMAAQHGDWLAPARPLRLDLKQCSALR